MIHFVLDKEAFWYLFRRMENRDTEVQTEQDTRIEGEKERNVCKEDNGTGYPSLLFFLLYADVIMYLITHFHAIRAK